MNANELLTVIATHGTGDLELMRGAIQAFEEATLNKFVATQYQGNTANIEVNVSDEMLARLFQRIQEQWTKVGASEPYASVLSAEKYAMKSIAANLQEFRQSGSRGIEELLQLAKKNNVNLNFNRGLELGCGVGRMTAHFASHFAELLAIDISPGNLQVAQNYLAELELGNVELKLLTQLRELENLPYFDVFVSFIAIQHNPPPIQQYLLQQTLSKLNPGGVFMFQTIVNHPAYGYSAEANFNYPEQDFEMHCLPMREIIKVINANKLTLLDVIKDRQGGYGIDSYTFFGINHG